MLFALANVCFFGLNADMALISPASANRYPSEELMELRPVAAARPCPTYSANVFSVLKPREKNIFMPPGGALDASNYAASLLAGHQHMEKWD